MQGQMMQERACCGDCRYTRRCVLLCVLICVLICAGASLLRGLGLHTATVARNLEDYLVIARQALVQVHLYDYIYYIIAFITTVFTTRQSCRILCIYY